MIEYSMYHRDIDPEVLGSTISREAVRAVICSKGKLLMVYSRANADYKFPGGGVESGETHSHALGREVMEECGYQIMDVGSKIGLVTEYAPAQETKIDTFCMFSHYYLCRISKSPQRNLKLDDYEADLGFEPRWITREDAIAANRQVLEADEYPRWTPRDTRLLEQLGGMSSSPWNGGVTIE